MTFQSSKFVPEQSGSVFDKSDVKRIKDRLDPLGETMTYSERLEEIAKFVFDYWDNSPVLSDPVEDDLRQAFKDIHWLVRDYDIDIV